MTTRITQGLRGCVAASVLFIAGCTIPGPHFDGAAMGPLSTSSYGPPAEYNLPVKLYTITPELVAELRPKAISPTPNDRLMREVRNYNYRIGPGDVLSFTVWNPEMGAPVGRPINLGGSTSSLGSSAPYSGAAATQRSADVQQSGAPSGSQVQRDGTIFFPYVGLMKVEGMTIPELRDVLTQRLDKIIQAPQVDVSVISYQARKIYVTGEVTRVGPLTMNNLPLTLLDAITGVGPFLPNADLRRMILIRDAKEYTIPLNRLLLRGDLGLNILLKADDILNFPPNEDNKVFMLGEVNSKIKNVVPMSYNGMSLGEALATVGGVNELSASPTGVFVLRTSPDDSKAVQVFQLDLSNAAAYVMADHFPMQPRDFVFVTAAPVARWNRVVGQLVPSLNSLLLLTNAASGR